MNVSRRDILRLAAGLPAISVGGLVATGTEVDRNGPSLEDLHEWCRIFAKAEVDTVKMFCRCTWPKQRYTGASSLWPGIVALRLRQRNGVPERPLVRPQRDCSGRH